MSDEMDLEDEESVTMEEAFYKYVNELADLSDVPKDYPENEINLTLSMADLKDMFYYAVLLGGNSEDNCSCKDREDEDSMKSWEVRGH